MEQAHQISKVDVGYAPWVIEESKTVFESRVLPLLLDDNNHYRLYGIFTSSIKWKKKY